MAGLAEKAISIVDRTSATSTTCLEKLADIRGKLYPAIGDLDLRKSGLPSPLLRPIEPREMSAALNK